MSAAPTFPTEPSPLCPLSSLALGRAGWVRSLRLEAHESEWLRALGLCEGQRVTLVRRAPFGGPLHVRTESGGEFAIDRALAGQIHVAPAPDGTP